MKKVNTTLLLFALVFFVGCINEDDFIWPTQSITSKQERSKIDDFKKQVGGQLDTRAVKEQIHELRGTMNFDQALGLETSNGRLLQFIPIYDRQHESTQAIIVAVAFGKYITYGLAERGELW